MPNLAQHQASEVTKALVIGESGSGKSGALASLASAGYNLRILDFDNGLDVLFNLLTDPKSPYDPQSASRVHYQTLTEPMRSVNGRVVPAKATVWQKAIQILDGGWKEGTPGEPDFIDLGKINTWGPRDVLVIDTLTRLCDAAQNFYAAMNGKLGVAVEGNEGRRAVWQAQQLIERLLELLYDKSIGCNVIVNSHITYVDEKGAMAIDGESSAQIGYPSALGRALSPKIPRYFNSMLLLKPMGTGQATRRLIYTQPQGIVGAKSSAPLKVKPSYPVETGLAEYFAAVRGASPTQPNKDSAK